MTGKRPEGSFWGDGDFGTIHLRSVHFTVCKCISKTKLAFLYNLFLQSHCSVIFLNAGSFETPSPQPFRLFLVIQVSADRRVYQIIFHIKIIFKLKKKELSELSFEISENLLFKNHTKDGLLCDPRTYCTSLHQGQQTVAPRPKVTYYLFISISCQHDK